MKALSILQPWASLIVHGHKKIETRSFQRSYRGPLLIHASMGYSGQQETLAFEFSQQLNDSRVYHNERGAIIGMVELVDMAAFDDQFGGALPGRFFFSDTAYRNGLKATWDLTEKEHAFGDYGAGRYGWLLSNPIVFPQPIPCKGNLGLWNPTPEVMAQVEEQVKAVSS